MPNSMSVGELTVIVIGHYEGRRRRVRASELNESPEQSLAWVKARMEQDYQDIAEQRIVDSVAGAGAVVIPQQRAPEPPAAAQRPQISQAQVGPTPASVGWQALQAGAMAHMVPSGAMQGMFKIQAAMRFGQLASMFVDTFVEHLQDAVSRHGSTLKALAETLGEFFRDLLQLPSQSGRRLPGTSMVRQGMRSSLGAGTTGVVEAVAEAGEGESSVAGFSAANRAQENAARALRGGVSTSRRALGAMGRSIGGLSRISTGASLAIGATVGGITLLVGAVVGLGVAAVKAAGNMFEPQMRMRMYGYSHEQATQMLAFGQLMGVEHSQMAGAFGQLATSPAILEPMLGALGAQMQFTPEGQRDIPATLASLRETLDRLFTGPYAEGMKTDVVKKMFGTAFAERFMIHGAEDLRGMAGDAQRMPGVSEQELLKYQHAVHRFNMEWQRLMISMSKEFLPGLTKLIESINKLWASSPFSWLFGSNAQSSAQAISALDPTKQQPLSPLEQALVMIEVKSPTVNMDVRMQMPDGSWDKIRADWSATYADNQYLQATQS